MTESFFHPAPEALSLAESPIKPTPEELQLAQEVLRRYPKLFGEHLPDDAELRLVELKRGSKEGRFELRFGLREPMNSYEKCDVLLYQAKITLEEMKKRYEALVHRPVDAEMLPACSGELEEIVRRYSAFMSEVGDLLHNPRRRDVRDEDEELIDRLVAKMRERMQIFTEEIATALEFLAECRIQKHLGIVRVGSFTAGTVAQMIMSLTARAAEYWRACRETGIRSHTEPEYAYAERGIHLFGERCYETLPRAQELQTLLEEEMVLARMCLRDRHAAAKPRETEPPAQVTELASPSRVRRSPKC